MRGGGGGGRVAEGGRAEGAAERGRRVASRRRAGAGEEGAMSTRLKCGLDKWLKGELDRLINEYGVDGFKLDAGDSRFYKGIKSVKELTPNAHTELFAKVGLEYPFNEYRATWKMGGQPLVQRLHDKSHDWTDIKKLIPQSY